MKRKIDELGRIVLPAEMKKEIGLVNGSEANIEIEDHKIIITKPNAIDYKTRNEEAIKFVKSFEYYIPEDDIPDLLEILEGRKTN